MKCGLTTFSVIIICYFYTQIREGSASLSIQVSLDLFSFFFCLAASIVAVPTKRFRSSPFVQISKTAVKNAGTHASRQDSHSLQLLFYIVEKKGKKVQRRWVLYLTFIHAPTHVNCRLQLCNNEAFIRFSMRFIDLSQLGGNFRIVFCGYDT